MFNEKINKKVSERFGEMIFTNICANDNTFKITSNDIPILYIIMKKYNLFNKNTVLNIFKESMDVAYQVSYLEIKDMLDKCLYDIEEYSNKNIISIEDSVELFSKAFMYCMQDKDNRSIFVFKEIINQMKKEKRNDFIEEIIDFFKEVDISDKTLYINALILLYI